MISMCSLCQQHTSVCAQMTLKTIVDQQSRRPECLHITQTSICRAIIPNTVSANQKCMAKVACVHTVTGKVTHVLSLTCSPPVYRMCYIRVLKLACQLAEASHSLYDVKVAVKIASLRATSLHCVLSKSLRNRAEPLCATVLHETVI